MTKQTDPVAEIMRLHVEAMNADRLYHEACSLGAGAREAGILSDTADDALESALRKLVEENKRLREKLDAYKS